MQLASSWPRRRRGESATRGALRGPQASTRHTASTTVSASDFGRHQSGDLVGIAACDRIELYTFGFCRATRASRPEHPRRHRPLHPVGRRRRPWRRLRHRTVLQRRGLGGLPRRHRARPRRPALQPRRPRLRAQRVPPRQLRRGLLCHRRVRDHRVRAPRPPHPRGAHADLLPDGIPVQPTSRRASASTASARDARRFVLIFSEARRRSCFRCGLLALVAESPRKLVRRLGPLRGRGLCAMAVLSAHAAPVVDDASACGMLSRPTRPPSRSRARRGTTSALLRCSSSSRPCRPPG